MSEFTLVRRGYNAKEVDEYISRNTAYLEDKLKEQKLRINELKAQNLKLAAKIKEMKVREDDVKNALIAANEKSKEILSAAKMRYAYEGQRLKLLQAKWFDYFESRRGENDDYKRAEAYYIKAETDIQDILRNDFGIATEKTPTVNDEIMSQYKSESRRLYDLDDDKNSYGEIIKNIKNELSRDLEPEAEECADTDIGDYDMPISLHEVMERGDYRNLASVRPDQSLEEMCRELRR